MHIGLITSSFLPVVGGMEWKVHFLASAYHLHGHQVTVFTIRPRLSLRQPELPQIPSYRLIRTGWPLPGGGRFGFTARSLSRAVLNLHRQEPLDLLHCHHLGIPTRAGLEVKRKTDLPVVATTCGADVQTYPSLGYGARLNSSIDRMVRENLTAVDAVGAISPSMSATLRELAPAAKLVDIPNGVSWDEFQIERSDHLRRLAAVPPGATILLSVGRNHPIKAYEVALEAFAETLTQGADCFYIIVGRDTGTLRP